FKTPCKPKQTPSKAARIKWSWPCCGLMPKKTPQACSSHTGARSPFRYGKNNKPSAPALTEATVSKSVLYAASPDGHFKNCCTSHCTTLPPLFTAPPHTNKVSSKR